MKRLKKFRVWLAFSVVFAVIAPFGAHALLNRGIDHKKKNNPIYSEIHEQYANVDVDSLVRIRSLEDLAERRATLLNVIFGKDGGFGNQDGLNVKKGIVDPDYSEIRQLERIDELNFSMPHGINSIAYYFHSSSSGERLAIYHEGHHGDFVNGKKLITKLLDSGFDVLAISMPLLGKNNRPIVQIPGIGPIWLKDHEWMRFLDDPLAYFMAPIRAVVDYASRNKRYQDISAIGFSGGAWSVSLYSAIDPRIANTYQIAGTMPFFLRAPVPDFYDGNTGDFEQRYIPLLKTVNYPEIYVMGSVGADRRQVQVINKYDSVAAHGVKYKTYDAVVRRRIGQLGAGGTFDVLLDETNQSHSISEQTMNFLIRDLNKRQAMLSGVD